MQDSYPRLEVDEEVDTAYLYFKNICEGEAVKQFSVTNKNGDTVLVVDLSQRGEILGIEFLNARTRFPGYFPK
ncbi:DUF2283 domain-containing protein [Streptomyces sp. YS-3]|uniref:DUF2283 domain-containing protein n=1 Tax=Streptomyces sp. YS-3 TaxID=3381352 RepID=UPI00386296E1